MDPRDVKEVPGDQSGPLSELSREYSDSIPRPGEPFQHLGLLFKDMQGVTRLA